MRVLRRTSRMSGPCQERSCSSPSCMHGVVHGDDAGVPEAEQQEARVPRLVEHDEVRVEAPQPAQQARHGCPGGAGPDLGGQHLVAAVRRLLEVAARW